MRDTLPCVGRGGMRTRAGGGGAQLDRQRSTHGDPTVLASKRVNADARRDDCADSLSHCCATAESADVLPRLHSHCYRRYIDATSSSTLHDAEYRRVCGAPRLLDVHADSLKQGVGTLPARTLDEPAPPDRAPSSPLPAGTVPLSGHQMTLHGPDVPVRLLTRALAQSRTLTYRTPRRMQHFPIALALSRT